jgi:tRNA1(Val) A37 N6-methylase TrmN6
MSHSDSPIFCQKRSGAFFTPGDTARALTAWVLRRPSDRLIDPSCGDGQFLTLHRNSVGIEQNPASAQAAIAAAPWALVHKGDFFSWAAETPERFECAAGNPPFIRYQNFSGAVRKRAIELCAANGAAFSGLTSSWAPFLVATATLLKPGGRLGFVVPAEIGHAPYAAPLLEYLVARFAKVQIVAVREKIFPTLSEDCWLLYADGYGGSTPTIDLSICDRFKAAKAPPPVNCKIDVDEWRSTWSRRLRPFLLPKAIRDIYKATISAPDCRRLGDFARVGIGYISGDNDFFHLRPSEAKRLAIPSDFLHPSLRNGRAMPEKHITRATVDAWTKSDEKVLLLRLPRDGDLPATVRDYLESTAGREARRGYKCRNRTPWYAVPDVQVPDLMLSYMSGRSVNLVRNLAGVTCTNSIHSVRLHDLALAERLLPSWGTPFVRLSCEIEGHALGGGMLKLEPREATRIAFTGGAALSKADADAMDEGVRTLQHWRHYAD